MLTDKLRPKEAFTPAETKELRAFVEALTEALKGKRARKLELVGSERVSKFIFQVAVPIKHRSFLAEMALSYLIAHEEAFIKDYLLQLLLHKRQLLISNATVTHEELAAHSSIRSVWEAIAQKEVDALGYGSIDDIAQYFSKKLGIDLTRFQHWPALREHSYRRNLIIHNRGRINDIYRKKTGYKERTGRVETDMYYVSSAVSNLSAFIRFVHLAVCAKFRLRDLTLQRNRGHGIGDRLS